MTLRKNSIHENIFIHNMDEVDVVPDVTYTGVRVRVDLPTGSLNIHINRKNLPILIDKLSRHVPGGKGETIQ